MTEEELKKLAEKRATEYFRGLSDVRKRGFSAEVNGGFYLWDNNLTLDENELYRDFAYVRFKQLLGEWEENDRK